MKKTKITVGENESVFTLIPTYRKKVSEMKEDYLENECTQSQCEAFANNWEANDTRKSVLIVDFYYIYKKHIDFNNLFERLELEFDELKIFARIPDEHSYGYDNDIWGAVKAAVKSGVFITLYPGNADPMLTVEILNCVKRDDVKKITVISANQGLYEALRIARRSKKEVNVILSNESNCWLLRRIANLQVNLEDYLNDDRKSILTAGGV